MKTLATKTRRGSILLVDDDPQLTHVVALYFGLEGYTVLEAKNGEQALAQMLETKPDIVLLDVLMPGIDGAEVCRAIRSDKRIAQVPIVVFTAVDSREDELREAGADRFIVKPFSLEGLATVVRELAGAGTAPSTP